MALLAVDVMGGDLGPHFVLSACREFLRAQDAASLRLFVDQALESKARVLCAEFPSRIDIEVCPTVVEAGESAMSALRNKRESTMAMALNAVCQRSVDGMFSLGNTAALVALSRHVLSLFPGVDRPALATYLPTEKGRVLVLDLGATVHTSADQLIQFAVMGRAWRVMQKASSHRLALINMGTEPSKGPEEVRLAGQWLETQWNGEYVGFCEPNQLWSSSLDIAVCSGLVGNTLLKSAEGVAQFLLNAPSRPSSWRQRLKQQIERGFCSRRSSSLSRWLAAQPHGALLLGVRGLVVKGHGCSGQAPCVQALNFLHQQAQQFDADALMREMMDEMIPSVSTDS